MYCKNKGLMIYQCGENLITKQKHIHLREVAEHLKMRLGKEGLGRLSAKGRWFLLLFESMKPFPPHPPFPNTQLCDADSTLNLNSQQKLLEFIILHSR